MILNKDMHHRNKRAAVLASFQQGLGRAQVAKNTGMFHGTGLNLVVLLFQALWKLNCKQLRPDIFANQRAVHQ